jgi:RHS repeat-associated protein
LRNELDDETQLNYFGARYFDPFFGLWMSPDPAGQFANPYSYGGDPVNFVDPNGEYRTINRKG